ncbi:MAG: outer membrane protein assembly factor BamB [Zoogloeaceae bacterium]|nr:outer membrane protein assembly factor BamB [Zoogloeaceae bacterium]
MRSLSAPVLLLAAGLVLTGCSSLNPFAAKAPKPADAPAFQPKAEIRALWQARVGSSDGYVFQPTVVDGSVYAAGAGGTVARIDQDGRTRWSRDVGARLTAGVGSDGRTVAVVTARGELIVLDAETGTEKWRKPAGVEVLAPPGVSARTIALRASDSRILGFDVASGERRWIYARNVPPLSLRATSGMQIEGNFAVVGFPGGKLLAINLDSGAPRWELTVANPRGVTELERVTDIAGTAVLMRSEACAVAFQGRVSCFDLRTRSAIWTREFSSSAGMDRDGPLVVITSADDSVHGLDARSGVSQWKQGPMFMRRLSRPLIVGDAVVFGDFEGYVHVLDRNQGGFIARTRADGGAIEAEPRRLGARSFVVQTRGGAVQAFEIR